MNFLPSPNVSRCNDCLARTTEYASQVETLITTSLHIIGELHNHNVRHRVTVLQIITITIIINKIVVRQKYICAFYCTQISFTLYIKWMNLYIIHICMVHICTHITLSVHIEYMWSSLILPYPLCATFRITLSAADSKNIYSAATSTEETPKWHAHIHMIRMVNTFKARSFLFSYLIHFLFILLCKISYRS